MPTEELPPLTPSTDHFTEVFEYPATVAVNCCDALAATSAEAGLTASVGLTVTEALALFVVSAALVALTVWLPASDGAA